MNRFRVNAPVSVGHNTALEVGKTYRQDELFGCDIKHLLSTKALSPVGRVSGDLLRPDNPSREELVEEIGRLQESGPGIPYTDPIPSIGGAKRFPTAGFGSTKPAGDSPTESIGELLAKLRADIREDTAAIVNDAMTNTNDVVESHNRIAELEAECKKHKDECKAHETAISELTGRINNLNDENQSIRAKVTEQENELIELRKSAKKK